MNHNISSCLFAILFLSQSLLAQDFDDFNNLAIKERASKNYTKAIELCNSSIAKRTNARAYYILGLCHLETKDHESAINDFSSALTYYSSYYNDDKNRGGIYYFRGRSRHNLKKYTEAIEDYGSAIYYSYDNTGLAYWNRGACKQSLGKYKEADDDYNKAIGYTSDNKDLSTLNYNRGKCQAVLKNYEDANTYFTKAIGYNTQNYNAYWERGYNKGIQGKEDEEISDYDKAIDILKNSGSATANTNLAILYRNKALRKFDKKEYEIALAAITNALAANPNYNDAYKTRAEIYWQLKDYEKANADYESAITLNTDAKEKAVIYQGRSVSWKKILNYKNCLDDLNKAIELNPESGSNYWHRSILYGYKKNYPAAIRECNLALERYKKDSASTGSLLSLRASHKDLSGDYKGAQEDYQLYLTYYPNSTNTYYELGRLFKLKIKNNDLANANLEKGADLALKDKDTSTYCYVNIIKGNKEEAIRISLEQIETKKNDEYDHKWALHNMACVYSLAGNATKGLEYLEKSMAAGFDDYPHLVNDRDLASLMKLPQWKTILVKYKVPTPKL